MSAPRLESLGRTERETLRSAIKILESRSDVSDRVIISGPFARMVARQLRRLLERNG